MSNKTLQDQDNRSQRTSPATKASRLGLGVFALFCVGLFVICLGLFLSWFELHAGSNEKKNQWVFSLIVNKSAVKESAKEVGEEMEKASESAQALAEMKTMEGRYVRSSSEGKLLVIEHESDEVPFVVEEATDVQIGSEEKALRDLVKGDKVAVIYRVDEDKKHAMKVRRLDD